MAEPLDKADPGARAAARLQQLRLSDQRNRTLMAAALVAVAVGVPIATLAAGDEGATVGAIIGAMLLVALAVAVWPYEWSNQELRHHTLDSIWREARGDADEEVPWERLLAWAEPSEQLVELALIHCAPATPRTGDAPSPYGRAVVQRLPAEDIAGAAQAMEELKAKAAERELEARDQFEREQLSARQRAHDAEMQSIEQAAAARVREAEEQAKRELAAEEAAERKAQAEAVARALRQP